MTKFFNFLLSCLVPLKPKEQCTDMRNKTVMWQLLKAAPYLRLEDLKNLFLKKFYSNKNILDFRDLY